MCKTQGCLKSPDRGNYCHCCSKRRYREKNPLKSSFIALKDNAKRRGKSFDLTFEQFENFAVKTKYHINSGRTAESYHIDRKDELKGYSLDNIQILTNSENVRKFVAFKGRDENNNVTFQTITIKNSQYDDDECPY